MRGLCVEMVAEKDGDEECRGWFVFGSAVVAGQLLAGGLWFPLLLRKDEAPTFGVGVEF